ncbi:ScbR family autoregulator-binding transcription factor [Streptomyces sp. 142MFCol3.1]|uniref:ScbR family autoregulator-binding transcription factor n=1 Tax=Streptomyces sp. 142MFCol3.1 TaxID=1172179 RepID=UPI000422E0C5|nr:ScbR family autoregulator-binding transcription factor [Streptomyces sp. 142MFCol3.1]
MVKQERSGRTRGNLIRAASTVFDQVGYERATLLVISELAQVTKGALSFHFAAKSDLARAVQAEACTTSGALLAQQAERRGPGFDIAVDMAHTLVRLLETDVVVRAGTRLTQEIDTPDDPAVHCHLNWLGSLYRTLRRARTDGSLRPGVDVRPTATLMMSLITGTSSLTRTHTELAFGKSPFSSRESAEQRLTRMIQLVRPALSGS